MCCVQVGASTHPEVSALQASLTVQPGRPGLLRSSGLSQPADQQALRLLSSVPVPWEQGRIQGTDGKGSVTSAGLFMEELSSPFSVPLRVLSYGIFTTVIFTYQ